MPCSSSQRITPDAASSPHALPPARRMRVDAIDHVGRRQQVGFAGSGRGAAYVTPATAPSRTMTTLQPVGRRSSVKWPTSTPATSVIAPPSAGGRCGAWAHKNGPWKDYPWPRRRGRTLRRRRPPRCGIPARSASRLRRIAGNGPGRAAGIRRRRRGRCPRRPRRRPRKNRSRPTSSRPPVRRSARSPSPNAMQRAIIFKSGSCRQQAAQ